MAIYHNLRQDSPIRAVEVPADKASAFSFLHIGGEAEKEAAMQRLTSVDPTQKIIAETKVDGHPVLITQGTKTATEVLDAFNAGGDQLVLPKEEKEFNPWAWRGITSIVGQSLQLASSLKASKTAADRVAIGSFAVTNLTANFINIFVGSQEKDDPHQLRVLKEQCNETFKAYLPQGETLPEVDEQRAALRPKEPRSAADKAKDTIRKYSVSGGEIGLRTFGSLSLSFPATRWASGFRMLRQTGSLGKAVEVMKNDNPYTYKVGLLMMLGKFISFLSKEPDPYNPVPPSALDKFRENVTFRLSSVVEAGATALMTYDRFKNQKFTIGGKQYPDYFGGVGNLVFIGGYGVRLFAPYGSLEVNMKELNAHMSDCLAKMPRDKLPQLLADMSGNLKQHFKDKEVELSALFTELSGDLKKHYAIDLPNPLPNAEKAVAQTLSATPSVPEPRVLASNMHSSVKPSTQRYEPLRPKDFAAAAATLGPSL